MSDDEDGPLFQDDEDDGPADESDDERPELTQDQLKATISPANAV